MGRRLFVHACIPVFQGECIISPTADRVKRVVLEITRDHLYFG